MTEFIRFPHTPHLAWLGRGRPRADKVLSPREASELLSGPVVVEEKVDGANLGFSVDERGALQMQNRGSFLDRAHLHPQFRPLTTWLATREQRIAEALAPGLILFGEWCYAVHSVRYTRLPDWFLAFDVYDRTAGSFWTADARNELAQRLDLQVVPRLGAGPFTLPQLESLLHSSKVTEGPAEGLYVRREDEGRLVARAKLVRSEFVQAIEEHWSRRAIEPNAIAYAPLR